MIKKPSKTDHVLNLFTGYDQVQEFEAEENTQGLEDVNISVVSKNEESKTLADSIKKSLEESLDAAQINIDAKKYKEGKEVDIVANNERSIEAEEKMPIRKEPLKKEPIKKESIKKPVAKKEPEQESLKLDGLKQEPKKASTTKASTTKATASKTTTSKTNSSKKKEAIEPIPNTEYQFVNVMETIINNQVIKYMEKFGNCTCSRCIADTTALSLNNVPSKYVVARTTETPPLLDYYERKYMDHVVVAITNACVKVGQFPKH